MTSTARPSGQTLQFSSQIVQSNSGRQKVTCNVPSRRSAAPDATPQFETRGASFSFPYPCASGATATRCFFDEESRLVCLLRLVNATMLKWIAHLAFARPAGMRRPSPQTAGQRSSYAACPRPTRCTRSIHACRWAIAPDGNRRPPSLWHNWSHERHDRKDRVGYRRG
jgi:hypothetical protein